MYNQNESKVGCNSPTGGVLVLISRTKVSPQLPSNFKAGLTRLDSVADGKVRMRGVIIFMSEITKDSPKTSNEMRKIMIRKIAAAAILTALAVVLMYLEFPLPFMPAFLQFDFSEVPVLIGSFCLGPVYGIIIELLKNLIHLPGSHTAGIGEMSNFITGSIYVFTAGYLYTKKRTRSGAIAAMLTATVVLALFAIPFNYFVTLPLYGKVLHFSTEAIVGMCNAANSLITNKWGVIMWAFVPFNFFKGFVVAFITFWIYKPISKLIHDTYRKTH